MGAGRKTSFDLAVFCSGRPFCLEIIAVGSCSRSRRIRNISVCENQPLRSTKHRYSVGVHSIATNTHQKSDCLAIESMLRSVKLYHRINACTWNSWHSWNSLDILSIHILTCVYIIYIYIPSQVVRNGCFTWRGRPADGTDSAGDALREGLSTTLLGFGPVNFVEAYPDTYPFSVHRTPSRPSLCQRKMKRDGH